jgi:hypothetical protein
VHRGAFAQELRVDAHAELLAGALAGELLECRDDHLAHGSRQHGAAHDDNRGARVRRERIADFLAHAAHVLEVDAAVRQARRADAHQAEIGLAHGVREPGGGAQLSGRDLGGDDRPDVGFDDRRFSGVDELDLGALRVDADDFVTVSCKAGRGDGTDVPEPQHADFHSQQE